MYTGFVMQPGQAAIRLRVEVTLEDAGAHRGLIVGLDCGAGGLTGTGRPGGTVAANLARPPAASRLHSKGNCLIDCPSRCPCGATNWFLDRRPGPPSIAGPLLEINMNL